MTAAQPIPAFAGYGIELEYAIVDADSLDVRPIADRLLRAMAGHDTGDVEHGLVGWSNELVLHVIELKNLAPTKALATLPSLFQDEIRAANRVLASMSSRLMPTGVHPWMNPRAETLLWAQEGIDVYTTFDRVFNCRSHGWANLQSMHINLPFADDDQFARLHAAVRLVLPLLPALAASSPIAEGKLTGMMDYRLEVYRNNSERVPSIAGRIIPETVESRNSYERLILEPMYREIAPLDPQGVLCHEWLNSRGAIARFDRNAIEIRLADVQECPQADLAIASATAAVVESLYRERHTSLWTQQAVPTDTLLELLLAISRDAEQTIVDDAQVLSALGMKSRRCKAGDIWQFLIEESADSSTADAWWRAPISFILEHGSLARRIANVVAEDGDARGLHDVYRRLCECLDKGQMFH